MSEDDSEWREDEEQKSDSKLKRRPVLAGAAAGLGVGALGLGALSLDNSSYLTDVNRGQVEAMAKNQRNNLEQLQEDFEAANSSLPISSDLEDYNDRGKTVADSFLLKHVDPENTETFIVPREQNGQNVEYVLFEEPDSLEMDNMDFETVVDRTDNDISNLAVSQVVEGRKKSEIEDFAKIVPYLASNDDRSPNVNGQNLDELESLKQDLDETIENDYMSIISDLENISTTSGDLINDEIRSSDTDSVRTLGNFMLSGDGYSKDRHLTEAEARNLLNGEDQYEDRGLHETKNAADEMLEEVAAQTVKTAIVSDTIGRSLDKAGRTSDFYFEHRDQTYAGLNLDEDVQNEIDSYAAENNLDAEDLDYSVRVTDDDSISLRYGEDIASGNYEEISVEG